MRLPAGSAVHNFSPHTFVRKNLQEQAVRHPTIDKVDPLHPFLEGTDGALHLGTHALVDDPALAPVFDRLRERHPLNRFAEPSEIGETVKWLLSDAASFVTGAAIAVDGGYLAT